VYDPGTGTWTAGADAPVDIFAGQVTAGGGLLVVAGGAANSGATLTTQTIAYDPATNAWQTLPAMATALYRGAAACGAYRVGGSVGSFVGSNSAAFLDGLGNCDASGDVTWLSEDPSSVTLAPGESTKIKVTLDATEAAGILQPGKFTAQIALRTDTPYAIPAISVELNVNPQESWGKLLGKVTGTSCNGTVTPLKATLRLNSTTGYTVMADASGSYQWWLPEDPYQVIVAKDGWTPEVHEVDVEAGFVKTVDYNLAPVVPCATAQKLTTPGIV
jgi:hypothetical protein